MSKFIYEHAPVDVHGSVHASIGVCLRVGVHMCDVCAHACTRPHGRTLYAQACTRAHI